MRNTILCIDDNEDTCELLTLVFRKSDYEVTVCHTSQEGLRLAEKEEFAAIISDYYLDDKTGIEICRTIRRFNREIPIIFFSAESRRAVIETVLAAGAQEFIVKPSDFNDLRETVIKLIEARRLPKT